jgi:hypothetical protein
MCTSKLLVERKKKRKQKSNNKKIPNQKGSRHCCRGTVFYWEVKTRDAPKSIKSGCKGRTRTRRLCVQRLKPKWVKSKGLKKPDLALLRE